MYAGVVFDNLYLAGSKWTGAVLERASFQGATLDKATGLNGTSAVKSRLSAAKFNNASVRNVDLSNAELYGALFINADLSNSSLAGSVFTSNTAATPPIVSAAHFDGAHMRNVTLAGAKLQSATFQYASLYGSFGGATPPPSCQTPDKTSCTPTGFTCSCATAAGADLTATDFSNAFLYGVDFSGSTTIVNGTNFSSAILTGASFAAAGFRVNGGAAPDFTKALLQGTIFSANASLADASFLNAFVDFGKASNPSDGNALYLLLSADYTRFRGWTGAATPCVAASYQPFSVVPSSASMVCPHGFSTVCGDGTTQGSLANWKSGIAMASNTLPGWYYADSTYDNAPADPTAICRNNGQVEPKW
jgi:uncharacterized protein YjbI with pentapeptide repeats